MDSSEFDAKVVFQQLRSHSDVQRKMRPYKQRKSVCDRYAGELLALRRQGATLGELQRWLQGKKCRCSVSTLSRWMNKHA
ncbi:hypothetical protein [Aliagarivorans taiwanensis]|uniref:hypothetical protein n=1 Tax=Aliagarivorans taiwanensis TaxID=561966 RepID=UPI0003FFBAA6|nr:hypothetical protein [Aliagarivorans taiwanensis]